MTSLVAVELAKVRTTRLWIGLAAGGLGFVVVVAAATLAVMGSPEAAEAGVRPIRTVDDVREFVTNGSAVGVFALILGATVVTTEHRHRTLAGAFLSVPTRWPVVVAKVVAATIVGLAFGALGGLVTLGAVAVRFAFDDGGLPIGGPVWLAVLAVAGAVAFEAAVGAALGAALRGQLLTILVLLAWALVVEPAIGGLVPAAAKWLPFTGLTGSIMEIGGPDLFSPPIAGLVMLLYLALAVAVGVAVTMTRDVR
jgi:hypothetical protein